MSKATGMPHISSGELVDYFAGRLSAEREAYVEEHFAQCDHCTTQARHYRRLAPAWESWTAQSHGEAYRHNRLLALEEAGQGNPDWKERVRKWRNRWSETARQGLQFVVETPGQEGEILSQELGTLFVPQPLWQYVSVEGQVWTRGGVALPGAGKGKASPRVVVRQKGDEIAVTIDPFPPGLPPPLVLLTPAGQGSAPQLKALERSLGQGHVMTSFRGVEPGGYVLDFEPAS